MLSSPVDSLAIFMMMEHNKTSYVHFLRILRGFRLKYCYFCCWHRMVDRQLERLDVPGKTESEDDTKGKETVVSPAENTRTFSNISKGVVYGSNKESMDLSAATRTNVKGGEGIEIIYEDCQYLSV